MNFNRFFLVLFLGLMIWGIGSFSQEDTTKVQVARIIDTPAPTPQATATPFIKESTPVPESTPEITKEESKKNRIVSCEVEIEKAHVCFPVRYERDKMVTSYINHLTSSKWNSHLEDAKKGQEKEVEYRRILADRLYEKSQQEFLEQSLQEQGYVSCVTYEESCSKEIETIEEDQLLNYFTPEQAVVFLEEDYHLTRDQAYDKLVILRKAFEEYIDAE